MEPLYLRVKNWGKYQHYRDKEPGWIKFYADVIRDSRFLELTEQEQWQLVRIWVCASQSSRFTTDDEGRKVPVLPHDERSLRRSIATLKKIPLARLIRDGWLIPVDEDELEVPDAVPAATQPEAQPPPTPSPELDVVYTGTSPTLEPSSRALSRAGSHGRGREELPEEPLKAGTSTAASNAAGTEHLPVANDFLVQRLMRAIGPHADGGTLQVLRAHAAGLPEASLAKVCESVEGNPSVRDRARYVVSALRSERDERTAA